MKRSLLILSALTILTGSVAIAADDKPSARKVEGTIHSIALPNLPHELPPGPNSDVYVANCTSCHTSRYVSNQPPFPRKVWEAEVVKMVKIYGAPIDEEKQKQIIDYLVAIRGVPDAAPAASPAAK